MYGYLRRSNPRRSRHAEPDPARKAGVSIMAIKNLESQKRKPRKKTLSRVVKALDDDGITFLEHGIPLKELTYGRRN
jgi:hypothetical protein